MTRDELDVCRVFLAAFRQVEHNGRIEVLKRDNQPPQVRIIRGQVVTASATIKLLVPTNS